DILKIIGNLPKLIPSNKKFKIVGNIPYYITGRLLRKIGELEVKPEICVFTLQKEVAERICAQPPNFNRLSAILGFWAECQIIKIVPRQFFSPKPRVDSAIILLKSKNNFKEVDFKKYCFLVNILFRQPRKTILNNLLFLSKNKKRWLNLLNILKIPPLDRPQKLNIYQIINLVKLI
ncbi:MAG: rRNA adenine dimethyltransferase family protein, partial [bacterium]|nr:rRNA adenine dimethyltransferase family protein [bacterium]